MNQMTSNTERMASGDWYITDESVLEIQRERQTVMELYNATSIADPIRRRELLVQLMGTVGNDIEVRSPVYVDYGSNIHFGTGVFLNYGCQLADVARITIGDHVQIGPYVQLLTPLHPLDAGRRRDKWETARPITIGDNVWLAGGVIVSGRRHDRSRHRGRSRFGRDEGPPVGGVRRREPGDGHPRLDP